MTVEVDGHEIKAILTQDLSQLLQSVKDHLVAKEANQKLIYRLNGLLKREIP